jgi:hypothetical protein
MPDEFWQAGRNNDGIQAQLIQQLLHPLLRRNPAG